MILARPKPTRLEERQEERDLLLDCIRELRAGHGDQGATQSRIEAKLAKIDERIERDIAEMVARSRCE
jgi:hypothetical protein